MKVDIYCLEIGFTDLMQFQSQRKRVPAATLFHRTLALAHLYLLEILLGPLFMPVGRLPSPGPELSLLGDGGRNSEFALPAKKLMRPQGQSHPMFPPATGYGLDFLQQLQTRWMARQAAHFSCALEEEADIQSGFHWRPQDPVRLGVLTLHKR